MLPHAVRRFVVRRLGIDALRTQHAALLAEMQAQQARSDQLAHATADAAAQLAALRAQLAEAQAATAELRSSESVAWGTVWSHWHPAPADALVSVVLPTRNRAHLLQHAIASVLQQSHAHLELIVVDDGSTDDTAIALKAVDDPRLAVLDGGGNGAAAARNLALQHAHGSVIAFADDDNLMAPDWLATAAGHLHEHPQVGGVYGAQLREPETGGHPTLLYRAPFDREAMLLGPYVDLGATVFRAGTEGLHFDTTLTALLDWDMLIRVTATSTLEAIPVLAGLYTTSAPGRITDRPDKAAALATVRERAAAALSSPSPARRH